MQALSLNAIRLEKISPIWRGDEDRQIILNWDIGHVCGTAFERRRVPRRERRYLLLCAHVRTIMLWSKNAVMMTDRCCKHTRSNNEISRHNECSKPLCTDYMKSVVHIGPF